MSWLPSYSSYCNNYQEAGVICQCEYWHFSIMYIVSYIATASTCTDNGQVRLYGSSSPRLGNIQVCVNKTWQAVCGQGNSKVDNNLASVVCRELGYSQYGKER